MLPGFHSLQDAILLARRQTAETLQTLAQQLLARGRKAAKLGIIVQGFLLLLGRKILVASQPLSGVIALPGLPARLTFLLPLLDAFDALGLADLRCLARRYGEHQHDAGGRRRCFRRDGLEF